jgi:DMSO reductase family type II enzyme chaperone
MTYTAEPTITRADETLARAMVLRLLSQVFAYPTPDDVERLTKDDVPLALDAAGHLPEPVEASLHALAVALVGAAPAELESRYGEVFTHVHSGDCPIYETDYGPRDVWRQSNELADLAGFYRAFGFDPQGERPDHAAVELEFLHVLAYKEVWASVHDEDAKAAVCRDASAAFERDHALRWLPALAARVAALAVDGPYAAASALLASFCEAEIDRVGEVRPLGAPAPRAAGGVEADLPGLCEEGA